MNQLTFFKNWWELAENRDTDEKRLAFYDAIMRFAFEGKVPERPVKGVSRDVDHAAWDAYQSVFPVVSESIRKSDAGSLGGRGNVSQKAPRKADAKQTQKAPRKADAKQTQSTAQSRRKGGDDSASRSFRIEENRIEENRIVDASASTTGGGGGRLPSREVFLSTCESTLGVPRDFADYVYSELSQFAGEDASGNKIGSWRRYVKAAWNREQSARAAASRPTDDAPRQISEDDL